MILPSMLTFFFGSPPLGFTAYPLRYSSWVSGFDTNKPKHPIICKYLIKNNKAIIKYVKYNLSDGNRSKRSFGIWLQIEGFKFKNDFDYDEVVNFIEDFVNEILEEKEVFFKKGHQPHSYIIKSFEDVDTANIITIFNEHFIKTFKDDLVPITSDDVLEKDLIVYELPQKEGPSISNPNTSLPKISTSISKSKSVPIKKKPIKIYSWLYKNRKLIIFFTSLYMVFYFDWVNKYYDFIFIFLLIIFCCIVFYKFFVKNSKIRGLTNVDKNNKFIEHPLDDNKFIAITAIVAIIGLIFTIYSKALIENDHSISKLILNSLASHSEYKVITNDTTCKNYIICIDKSGSVKNQFVNKPSHITKENIVTLFKDLRSDNNSLEGNGSAKEDSVFNNFIDEGLEQQGKISQSFLNKLKALKLINKPKLNTKEHVVLFGDSIIMLSNQNRIECIKKIISPDQHKNTDFIRLFRKLEKLHNTFRLKSEPITKKIILFSDFLHEKKYSSNEEKEKDKDTLSALIKRMSTVGSGFHFELHDFNPNNKYINNNVINIIDLFDDNSVRYNSYKVTKNSAYYDTHLNGEIEFFYDKTYSSSQCLISFNPASEGLTYEPEIENNFELGDIYYNLYNKNNKASRRSVTQIKKIKATDTVYLTYNGSHSRQPNNKLVMNQPLKDESFSIDIVFINVMSRTAAIILKHLFFLLVFFEIIYLSQMNTILMELISKRKTAN